MLAVSGSAIAHFFCDRAAEGGPWQKVPHLHGLLKGHWAAMGSIQHHLHVQPNVMIPNDLSISINIV